MSGVTRLVGGCPLDGGVAMKVHTFIARGVYADDMTVRRLWFEAGSAHTNARAHLLELAEDAGDMPTFLATV